MGPTVSNDRFGSWQPTHQLGVYSLGAYNLKLLTWELTAHSPCLKKRDVTWELTAHSLCLKNRDGGPLDANAV